MYEHATLQEAYTGALVAGKGKSLNNINVIMERMKVRSEAWVRVRFGAGVPWRRCWCVISPPDEKEFQKLQKEMKKRSPYDRSPVPALKGDIKFYENKKESTKKQKKSRPIATISDAQAAYAIYPQAKALIDASTLLKIEGSITIHSDPPSSTEGFVFIMPETNPAVTGFEMLLRYLFPTWDTFDLYGRPGRLVASTLDSRSLMFAMPKHRRYGYLDVGDVAGLIATDGSAGWSEREWRKHLKELTGQRMNEYEESGQGHSRNGSYRSNRLSHGTGMNGMNGNVPPRPRIGFAGDGPPGPMEAPYAQEQSALRNGAPGPGGPMQGAAYGDAHGPPHYPGGTETSSTDDDLAPRDLDGMRQMQTPEPVSQPPAFNHGAQANPGARAYHSADLRRANSRLSRSTLSHIAKAGGVPLPADGHHQPEPYHQGSGPRHGDLPQAVPVLPSTDPAETSANHEGSREVLNPPVPFPSERAAAPRSYSPSHRDVPRTAPGSQAPDGAPRPSTESRGATAESAQSPPRQDPLAAPQRPYTGSYRPQTPPGPGSTPQFGLQQETPRQGPQGLSGLHNELLPALKTSPPRKPLAQGSQFAQRQGDASPQTASSAESFGGHLIDQAILDQIRPSEADPVPEAYRQYSLSSASSSQYPDSQPRYAPQSPNKRGFQPPQDNAKSDYASDADSAASPDYASTHKSSETLASADRPRAGVLKTVGGGSSPTRSLTSNFSIPDVNFGPTINYGMQPKPKAASPPPERPAHAHRRSMHDAGHGRQESGDTIRRRSIMWQPASGSGSGSGSASPGGASVESYVQQRAAAVSALMSHSRTSSGTLLGRSTTPTMAHGRTPSGNTLRAMTPSPSMTRTLSEDLLTKRHSRPGSADLLKRHSRSSSADLLARPGSRGAATVLDAGGQEAGSRLSARDLEHVARATGSPLISMAGGNRQAQGNVGLMGAIEAREREKREVRAGYSSQTVVNAMQQRERQVSQMQAQQQQQQQQYQQQMQQQQAMQIQHPNLSQGQMQMRHHPNASQGQMQMHHANLSQGQMRFPPQQERLWQGQPSPPGYGNVPPGGHRQGSMGGGYPQQGQPRSPGPRGQSPGVPYGMGPPQFQRQPQPQQFQQQQFGYPQGGRGMYQGNDAF